MQSLFLPFESNLRSNLSSQLKSVSIYLDAMNVLERKGLDVVFLCYGKFFATPYIFSMKKTKQKGRIEEMNGHVNAKFKNSNM